MLPSTPRPAPPTVGSLHCVSSAARIGTLNFDMASFRSSRPCLKDFACCSPLMSFSPRMTTGAAAFDAEDAGGATASAIFLAIRSAAE